MTITILRPVELEVDAVRVTAPIRYEEDQAELAGKPGVSGNCLSLVLDLDRLAVRDWPAGETLDLHLKVVDQGTYELLRGDEVVATKAEEYVPRCLPQQYGDYLVMHVGEDGSIRDWNPHPGEVAECFDHGGDL